MNKHLEVLEYEKNFLESKYHPYTNPINHQSTDGRMIKALSYAIEAIEEKERLKKEIPLNDEEKGTLDNMQQELSRLKDRISVEKIEKVLIKYRMNHRGDELILNHAKAICSHLRGE